MTPPASRRVILHFGPPKTGSSALQAWCDRNRAALADHGVHYAGVVNSGDPKHQWLLKELQTGHFNRLKKELAACKAGTLILSCEGIMVHRASITSEAWAGFRAVLQGVATSLFLVQREPQAWTRSLWKQGVINPPHQGRIPVGPVEAFARQPWLREMIALPELARRMARDSGAGTVEIAPFEGDWFAQFKALAGLPLGAELPTLPRVHDGPPEGLVRLYLVLARGTADLDQLRLSLFALYCRAIGTTNLTLRNAARKFAAMSLGEQVGLIEALVVPLNRSAEQDPQLIAALAQSAADWLRELRG